MVEYLASFGFSTYTLDGNRVTERYGNALTEEDQIELDALIAAYVAPVPDLTPRQFKRFFALSGLDIFIEESLPALRLVNPEMYADVVSQLDGGTVYFYDVAESFMTQLLHILPNAPTVDFELLKQLWIEQSTHHIVV